MLELIIINYYLNQIDTKQIYLIIESFSIAAFTKLSLVSLSLVDTRNKMGLQVFSQISLLRELLQTEVALVGFDSFVHTSVIENVPSPIEFFIAVVEFSDVNGLRFVFTINFSHLCIVFKFFEKLEVHITLCHPFIGETVIFSIFASFSPIVDQILIAKVDWTFILN